jgi:CelD/BcsL family acetyltransferase involved in cellulose biosynthesis
MVAAFVEGVAGQDWMVDAQPRRGPRPCSRSHGASVRLIQDPVELAGFRHDWDALQADLPGPHTQLDWMLADIDSLPKGHRLCAVALLEEGRLTALAPLVSAARSWCPWLRWLFSENRSTALYVDSARLHHLVAAIYDLRRPVLVDGLAPEAPTARALWRQCPQWAQFSRPWLGGPSLPIDASWVAPLNKLSTKRRREMERTWRKARELGEVRFDLRVPEDDVLDEVDEFVTLEAAGWKGQAGTSLAQVPRVRQSLRRYLAAVAPQGVVRITRMFIGGDTAAMHLNVVAAGRWWGLKGAVDERYKAAAPGMHLFAYTIAAAAEEGLERFEFMGETAPFKEMWGAKGTEMYRWHFYPPTPGAVVVLGEQFGRLAVRKVAGELAERRVGAARSAPAAPRGPTVS